MLSVAEILVRGATEAGFTVTINLTQVPSVVGVSSFHTFTGLGRQEATNVLGAKASSPPCDLVPEPLTISVGVPLSGEEWGRSKGSCGQNLSSSREMRGG